MTTKTPETDSLIDNCRKCVIITSQGWSDVALTMTEHARTLELQRNEAREELKLLVETNRNTIAALAKIGKDLDRIEAAAKYKVQLYENIKSRLTELEAIAEGLKSKLIWALDNMNPPFEFEPFMQANKECDNFTTYKTKYQSK